VFAAADLPPLLAAADDAGLGYAVRLWLDAGLRPGELFALDWLDLDPVAGTVTVRKSVDGKTNAVKAAKTAKSRRTLPLSRPTLDALAAARPPGGGVFLPTPSGGRWWAANFYDDVSRALFAAAFRIEAVPEGTAEAAARWREYVRACSSSKEQQQASITVDPITGRVSATANGQPVETVSQQCDLPTLSPIYRKLSNLFDKGNLVSIDKATRLPPLEVPVKPKWFGLETLTQIGSVKRQISYHISALKDQELKQLETRRKKIADLLDVLTFSLADDQRWMPETAQELFRKEVERVNTDAKTLLGNLITGDVNAFLISRRDVVRDDANRMCRDLFKDREVSKDALDEIMADLHKRFVRAQSKPFLPQVSLTKVSLPHPQGNTWVSQFGAAYNLLLSIIRYPRKAHQSGPFFGRGLQAKPEEILKAMNVLNDPFALRFDERGAKQQAEDDLALCDQIDKSEDAPDVKCERLFKMLSPEAATGVKGELLFPKIAEGH